MKYRELLKSGEVKAYIQSSNIKGLWLLLFNWSLIVLAFALPAIWLNPFTIVMSLLVLANRQLGLAILMHECAHYSLFKTRALNQWLGQILCGAPVLADLNGYRSYHMRHHKEAGTTVDPDYPNYKNYPVSRRSIQRKILRDFTGITGLKTLYALILMNAGVLSYDMSYKSYTAQRTLSATQIIGNLCKNLAMPVLVNLAMWSVLYLSGHAWLYLLWWVSYLTVYMFILRIRNAAEHGSVPDLLDKDPLLHARTTQASWLARLIFAPNFVNYHMEHHLQPNVPCYNLKRFHSFLKKKQVIDQSQIASGYVTVVKQLIAG